MTEYDLAVLVAGGFIDTNPSSNTYGALKQTFTITRRVFEITSTSTCIAKSIETNLMLGHDDVVIVKVGEFAKVGR